MTAQRLFEHYNQKYFAGRLVEYRVVTDGTYAGGRCDVRKRRIYLDAFGSRRRHVLIHEMCHASTLDRNHETVWLKEMIRVKKLGAPVLSSEIAAYSNPMQMPGIEDVFDEIADAARQPRACATSVPSIVKDILFEYGLLPRGRRPSDAREKRYLQRGLLIARKARNEGCKIAKSQNR